MERLVLWKPTTIALYKLLPRSKEDAMKRKTVAQALGISDRLTRAAIHQARVDGLFVLNDSDGRGYWISSDDKEIERFVRQENARAFKIDCAIKKMRSYLTMETEV